MSYPLFGHIFSALTAPFHQQARFLTEPPCPVLPQPQKNDRVLVLSPHPDDETTLAGGYIATAVLAGAVVAVVTITDGNAQAQAEARFKELAQALSTLGVASLTKLALPDGRLVASQQSLRRRLSGVIDRFRPTVLLLPHPADKHSDHAIVGQVGLELTTKQQQLLRLAYLDHFPPELPHPRSYNPKLFCWPPRSIAGDWVSFPLTDPVRNRKEQAIQAFQIELGRPILRSHLLSTIRRNEIFVQF